MLTELCGKGGAVCQLAREGKLQCPLIVRPTSEDVVTGNLFLALRAINPRWWLPDILNTALSTDRFRRQIFRQFKVDLWKKRPPYPRELLPWDEGGTEVDASIAWGNPPSTIFFEMKFASTLSAKTANSDGNHGYPTDQLARNIRVGLQECGWFDNVRLFPIRPKNFAVIVVSPGPRHPLVDRYRDRATVLDSIPKSRLPCGLPPSPFVGQIGYGMIATILRRQRRWITAAEKRILDVLIDYLDMKNGQFRFRGPMARPENPELFSDGTRPPCGSEG